MFDESNVLENIDELRKHKLFIATPMYGGNAQGPYTNSLCNLTYLLGKYGLNFASCFLWNESLITRGRNICVKEFLKSNADILFFIDADVGFNPYDVLNMMDVMTKSKDKKIVCGIYPKKSINWQNIDSAYRNNMIENVKDAPSYSSSFVVHFDVPDNETQSFNVYEPLKVRYSGTGFMMIHREVFEKYKESYPEKSSIDPNTGEEIFYYFDCEIDLDSKEYLSEDYMFCKYARKIGYDIWAMPWITLSHSGFYIHTGSFAQNAMMLYELDMKNNNRGQDE